MDSITSNLTFHGGKFDLASVKYDALAIRFDVHNLKFDADDVKFEVLYKKSSSIIEAAFSVLMIPLLLKFFQFFTNFNFLLPAFVCILTKYTPEDQELISQTVVESVVFIFCPVIV